MALFLRLTLMGLCAAILVAVSLAQPRDVSPEARDIWRLQRQVDEHEKQSQELRSQIEQRLTRMEAKQEATQEMVNRLETGIWTAGSLLLLPILEMAYRLFLQGRMGQPKGNGKDDD